MGGVVNTVKKTFSNPIRGLTAIATFGTSELARKLGPIPKTLASLPETASDQLLGTKYGETGNADIGGSGPFQVDPNQVLANKAAIEAEGKRQYEQTLEELGRVGASNTQRAGSLFKSMLPDIAENAQAAHLYDSTGYGQEVARQQANIASEIANQEAQQRLGALTNLQGFQSGALGRGLSLEDFINQANVAKTIGAQAAPQVGNGKGNTGAILGGLGSLAGGMGGLVGSVAGKAAKK